MLVLFIIFLSVASCNTLWSIEFTTSWLASRSSSSGLCKSSITIHQVWSHSSLLLLIGFLDRPYFFMKRHICKSLGNAKCILLYNTINIDDQWCLYFFMFCKCYLKFKYINEILYMYSNILDTNCILL